MAESKRVQQILKSKEETISLLENEKIDLQSEIKDLSLKNEIMQSEIQTLYEKINEVNDSKNNLFWNRLFNKWKK